MRAGAEDVAVSLRAIRCISVQNIDFFQTLPMNLSYSKSNRNYRGFSKYRKLNFCQVKIASALGGKGEEGIKLKTNFQCKKH